MSFLDFNYKKQYKNFPKNAKVLIAPLNWGIGHATRCVPIIRQLQEEGFKPIIASDADALLLLQKIFPEVPSFTLPGYEVDYAKNKTFFKTKLLLQMPKFLETYKKEKRIVKEIVEKEKIDVLISDNRFGVYYEGKYNIYITHQLRVKSGVTTALTTKIHQNIIKKFDECWVPDTARTTNLSGELSHNIPLKTPVKYIGLLSQFKKQISLIKYDILVLLSGPEPQRSMLETILLESLQNTTKKVCFVRGVFNGKSNKKASRNLTIYNYLVAQDLQDVINKSELIVARSGYSTIMDLAVLQKKAFFIPTPGQAEQIYLAKHIEKQGIAPFAFQDDFRLDLLDLVAEYSGFL